MNTLKSTLLVCSLDPGKFDAILKSCSLTCFHTATEGGKKEFLTFVFPPSGNTLKNIEKECCAKIMIRGKGSVKEGKVGRKDGQMLPGEDEPLHALVTANTMENVKKAVEQVGAPPVHYVKMFSISLLNVMHVYFGEYIP